MPATPHAPSGAYASLESLVRLRYGSQGFDFLPRQPVHSLLTGRYASRMRGRGLNFEELRAYLPGDDVRTIDWKVTARVQKPYVRVYTEERDRPAILVVDQRIAMFWGTVRYFKSVTAAQIAAVSAWRVVGVGDRVGAVVFDDTGFETIRPLRSQATVMRILDTIVTKNRALRADLEVQSNLEMLNQVLASVVAQAGHDYLIVIISDFDGADERTKQLVGRLHQHNDVLAISVYDPSATDFPESGRLVVSDGELQFELDTRSGKTLRDVRGFSDQRLGAILDWQKEIGVPVMPFSTAEEVLPQARMLLGRRRR